MPARCAVLGNCLLALAFALLTASPPPAYPEILPTPVSEIPNDAPVDDTPKEAPPPVDVKETGSSMAAMDTGGSSLSASFSNPNIRNNPFSGTAVYSIPIEVPPGRNGIAPNIALVYNSMAGNGWLGVGWNFDMGAIQRSTKFGVNYNDNGFVAMSNGSSADLVSRNDWGTNYYGAKYEGGFLKYFYNVSTGGWEVTAKNGTIYYYGTMASSRQDNATVVFKWCLDKVQDLNGNFMTLSYTKDQGQVYLDRIDYTGNANGLQPTNYVKFYLESRSDAPDMYTPNFRVRTAYRLKTIDVVANGTRQSAYKLMYSSSGNTGSSFLTTVQRFGEDATLDGSGTVSGGSQLPATVFGIPSSNNVFAPSSSWCANPNPYSWSHFWFTDVSGDGKVDLVYLNSSGTQVMVMLSTGSGFASATSWCANPNPYSWSHFWFTDVSGDGKVDLVYLNSSGTQVMVQTNGSRYDLLTSISNGIGGFSTITYTPSTQYENTQLPFPVQTLSSITVCDNYDNTTSTCIGTWSTTRSYVYSNGYYDIQDRDFRGFEYVKQVNPDQTTAETWFHQDNVYKGLMYQQVVRDSAGNLYDNTFHSYQSTSPNGNSVFPFLRQTDEYLYDGSPSYKHTASWLEYDAYGNITRKYSYGDVAIYGDERDERIEYAYDTSRWIVSLPSHTYVMDNAANIKAQSWLTYYSGTTNLYTKTNWLDNGVNPVTTNTYDSYGNPYTTTDPKGYVTTVSSYDPSYTYPTSVTSPAPMSFVSSKTYDYRYGKPLTETDVNNNTTTYQYDVFGRLTKIISPYDNTSTEGTQSIHYENFGLGAGYQRVATHATEQSGTGNFIWQENYFDGFGRTIKTRREGPRNPDNTVIVSETRYDTMGRVSSSSLPYFEGLETPRWVSYSYDPMGRVTRVTNPDNTFVTRSYLLGTTASIDANFHKREEERDAYGRLVEVREYTGASPNFTLYATTRYGYGLLGTLDNVTDAAGNVTRIGYDTLSRKRWMTDPDMGYWTYQYDANGNLSSQTDARNYTILFSYDALNRLTNKHYPTGSDVIYTYDETFSSNPKGRLTTVSDSSGSTKFHYDKLGRITSTVKTVDGVEYTTDSTYDALGRTTSVTYPDPGHEIVNYTYDTGGNLQDVVGYATFSNYNALGQAGGVTYGNGATTVYQYHPFNNRLFSITTNSQGQGRQNLSYSYDNVGNIRTITDLLDATRTQGFQYDDLNRIAQAQSTAYGTLTYGIDAIGNMTFNSQVGSYTYLPAKPHAVVTAGGNSYTYDPNGNMMGKNGATLTHDYENRLSSLVSGGTTTTFVYDFSGGRVKKTSSSITTLYIGKLYECTSGVCTKHIFAGGNRIVSKKPTGTYYYHTDHLRSSSVVTDASGAKVEEIYYYPFGQTRVNSGSVNLKHKYTGQEEDAETGLYFYNARYYDPAIGRFISADTIVQNFSDPQSFNRYSYARNNPLYYADPSGHYWQIVIGAVVGAVIGGIVAEARGQDIYKGMLYGAISGASIGAGDYISGGTLIGYVAGGAAGGGATTAVAGGSGNDILKGMLYGAAGSAAGYGVGYGIGYGLNEAGLYSNEYLQFGSQVVGGGLVGGGIAELSGGKFSEGFMSGAIGAAAGYGIGRFMKWNSARNEMIRKQAEAKRNLNVNNSDSTDKRLSSIIDPTAESVVREDYEAAYNEMGRRIDQGSDDITYEVRKAYRTLNREIKIPPGQSTGIQPLDYLLQINNILRFLSEGK